ncbi:isopentenyl-diphosphate Delta-isomerase [Cellulomonas edaphi]|uniref:Isopentenyl-diphosphate Delta-isomerase n=1 Tax=Cellulomonas edaphi TaxID=3053468 RepID=A0ABT7S6R8_9CELL|nr:isopentenyl-diphosphate Delta-isomerase [Cellulomons edaphi]MDM7831315.1 isopentenyl-diphosphate Delta-isomerase [Cellulomons edaphi]
MDHPPYGDLVVLLDPDGRPAGTAPRASVHGVSTPLHLAFSCYLLDSAGRLLVTRRALSKRTWPGVWTNAFCGHPRPGEPMQAAVHRHARHELGITVDALEVVLPDFRYTARDAAGVMENEVCPVFVATTRDDVAPHADEVADLAWTTPDELASAVAATPWAFSPWMVEQVPQLVGLLGGASRVPRAAVV